MNPADVAIRDAADSAAVRAQAVTVATNTIYQPYLKTWLFMPLGFQCMHSYTLQYYLHKPQTHM